MVDNFFIVGSFTKKIRDSFVFRIRPQKDGRFCKNIRLDLKTRLKAGL